MWDEGWGTSVEISVGKVGEDKGSCGWWEEREGWRVRDG